MVRGQLPKAYLRMDPDIDAKHPDNLGEYMRLLCAANRQPWRGRFRNRAVLEGIIGKAGAKRAIERGDLVPAGVHRCADCPPGEVKGGELYLDGWDIWQEGDHTVPERMRAYRSRNKHRNGAVTEHVTPAVTRVLRQQGSKAVPTEPTPEPPNPHDADDLEVLADGLLGHPATPNQLRAIRTLSRKVGQNRTVLVLREWLTKKADDPFGGALDQLGAEASAKGKASRGEFAYMDKSA